MTSKPTMSTREFNAALRQLELSPYAAAPLLGVSRSTAHRIARGDQTAPPSVALLLAMYLEHGLPQP